MHVEVEENRALSGEHRTRGLRVVTVLGLVALIPLLGVVGLTTSRVRGAIAEHEAATRTQLLARDTVTIAKLDAAVVDEMNYRSMDVVVAGIGFPKDVIQQVLGTDPSRLLPDAQARVDQHLAELGDDALASEIAAARGASLDLTGTRATYQAIIDDIEGQLAGVLDRLERSAATSPERQADLVEGAALLRAAIDVRRSVALQMQGYFAVFFEMGGTPAGQVVELVQLRQRYDAGMAALDEAASEGSLVRTALDRIATDRGVTEFLASVDTLVSTALRSGLPERAAPVSVDVALRNIDGFALVFRAGGESSTKYLDLLDAAGTEVETVGTALENESDADIRASYVLAAAMALASMVSAAVASWFIVRPLRVLQRAAHGLRENEDAVHAREPIGPAEVRAASAAIRDAAEHFDLVTRQARALAAGDLDAPVLDRSAPGGLGTALQDAVGTLRTALGQQDEFRRRLAHEAAHDGLTQLPNRNASLAQLTRSLARTTRSGSQLAVFFIDLDHFKDVNDHHGHQAGDAVLTTVAQRLVTNVREGDHVGRLGGDEFVVIAEPVEDVDDAVALGNRILEALNQPIDAHIARVNVGASIGIAMATGDGLTADELLRDADLAVYRAKETRRGTIEVCNEDLRSQLARDADLTVALRQAIEQDELLLHYQPIIEPASNRLHALEALVRWQRPGSGRLQPPDSFIPFAERSSLIVDIDRWVIDAVAAQIERWTTEGVYDGTPVAINVSGRHLSHDHFVQHVLQPLEDHGVDPRSVIIEVTESALLDDLARAAAKLQYLRDRGVQVAIDDFGTGYTSLAHLRSLPIDILKIDRSFTVNAARDAHESSIVKLIIDTGHLLGATITAEGVETEVEADALTELGSDSLQGYFYARPQPSESIVFGELPAGRPPAG